MLFSLTTAALAMNAPVEANDDHWAVLIAGSSGYGNYRHQADVCHAYQLTLKAGIPASNIIVLATDDIANSFENPYPGQLFNKPTEAGTPGVDVYAGCVIDYSGDDVTPEIFSKVLTGDASAGGKVLQSTADSRVFVNFVDHGGVGIIGFPRTTMHAKELIGDLQTMHDKGMYKELVFYLEACESGSMFEDLPDDIHIYATTAANAKESSWGTYCPPDDKVDGKSLNSCLGDLYSIKWMEDSDVNMTKGETLQSQFELVKAVTDKSHVTQFGDLTITPEVTSNFEGDSDSSAFRKLLGPGAVPAAQVPHRASTDLPSADAELSSAYHRYMSTGSATAARELMTGIQDREVAKARFAKMALAVTGKALTGSRPEKLHTACHYAAHKAYVTKCGEWTTGSLKHSADLAEMCAFTGGEPRPIVAAIGEACASA